jgi:hypothetical protein
MGTWAPLPELKRPVREVNHLPACSGADKNERRSTSNTLYAFLAWTGTASRVMVTYHCWRSSRESVPLYKSTPRRFPRH